MAVQRHPVDSFDVKLNFWEEFPDFKIHPVLGELWKANVKDNLKNSSLFMWCLSLCYDRKSAIFAQPELDKWEVSSENLFGKKDVMMNIQEDHMAQDVVHFPAGSSLRQIIQAFEGSIDTPLGLSLRMLEAKLLERTTFIQGTPYSTDYYVEVKGKNILKKGTADQLDRMFAATDKINALVQKALDDLRNSEGMGEVRGGEVESKGDGDKNF